MSCLVCQFNKLLLMLKLMLVTAITVVSLYWLKSTHPKFEKKKYERISYILWDKDSFLSYKVFIFNFLMKLWFWYKILLWRFIPNKRKIKSLYNEIFNVKYVSAHYNKQQNAYPFWCNYFLVPYCINHFSHHCLL